MVVRVCFVLRAMLQSTSKAASIFESNWERFFCQSEAVVKLWHFKVVFFKLLLISNLTVGIVVLSLRSYIAFFILAILRLPYFSGRVYAACGTSFAISVKVSRKRTKRIVKRIWIFSILFYVTAFFSGSVQNACKNIALLLYSIGASLFGTVQRDNGKILSLASNL